MTPFSRDQEPVLSRLEAIERRYPPGSSVPGDLGTVSKLTTRESPYRVFKIKDAHAGVDAQQGIVSLLRFLIREYGVTLICVEGGCGELVYEHLKAVLRTDDLARLKVMLRYKGVTAPEYLALTSDLPLNLRGIENPDLYEQNYLVTCLAGEYYTSEVKRLFERMQRQIDEFKERTFDKDLLDFDRAVTLYEQWKMGVDSLLTDWLCPHLDALGMPIDEYSSFPRILKALSLQDRTDYRQVNREISRLVRHISTVLEAPSVDRRFYERVVRAQRKLSRQAQEEIQGPVGELDKDEFRRFVKAATKDVLNLREAVMTKKLPMGEFFNVLAELAILCRLDLHHYPNMLLHNHREAQAETGFIDAKLETDIADATALIRNHLCRSDEERKALAATRAIQGVQQICNLNATNEQVDLFTGEFGSPSITDLMTYVTNDTVEASETLVTESSLADAEIVLQSSYRFYQLTPQRGREMAENTLRAMQEYNVSQAVLIAGGFLTNQVLSIFDRLDVSYTLITPPVGESSLSQEEYNKWFREKRRGSEFFDELHERAARAGATQEGEPIDGS